MRFQEPHRPQFHFTPPQAWMNDPNGMVYADGEYHLFYQHNPDTTVWGPMHWGHAISKDLVHWEHRPIALFPDPLGTIFSGSAVVDHENTAGFQTGDTPPLVAIFTQHSHERQDAGHDDFETQGLAFSNDRGRTWTMYEDNPVIPNPGIRDFRDPKVRWHVPSQQWVMALAVYDHIRFYGSPNLKDWTLLSTFGEEHGAHGGVWECPDLFPLTTSDGEEQWVLLVSINPGGPNGGSATQYFIGDFDGTAFTNANPADTVLWLDYGRDNYAGVTWASMPDDRTVFLGWMSNWHYAQAVPTEAWRSAMTVPRELALVETAGGLRLASAPVEELEVLRGQPIVQRALQVDGRTRIEGLSQSRFEAILEVDLEATSATQFGITLSNAAGDVYRLTYDRSTQQVISDRTGAGDTSFSDRFAAEPHVAIYQSEGATMQWHVLVDVASAEVFIDSGRVVLTDVFFPTTPFDQLDLVALDGVLAATSVTVYPLESIWK
ncbi:MAG: hypothetical protein RhofKO_19930 [Rhodothermales bacterium]